MATASQDHIGPYRLLKLVRSGHDCQVWEAINAIDNQRVAVKAIHRDHKENRGAVALLKHEYEVGKGLSDPNVISILDFKAEKGSAYLVMEYFAAPNLKQSLRQTPELMRYLSPGIILAGAKALQHVHDHGWVHRDIKPDNLLVAEDGTTKLIDFAIAQRIKKGFAKLISGKTKIQGTRSYMSPEQIRGEQVDGRSDIYSFGCLVYEVVGGKLPYTGSSADELLTKHLRAPVPSVIALTNDVTPEFSKLLAATMAKDPNKRPQSMNDFLEELEKIRVYRIRPKPPAGEDAA